MMGQRLLETMSPLLHLLSIVSPYCFGGRNHYLVAVAGPASQLFSLLCIPLLVVVCCFRGGQVAFEVFTSTFLVLFVVTVAGVKGLSKGMGSASLSCAVVPLHSLSFTCLLLLGLTGYRL